MVRKFYVATLIFLQVTTPLFSFAQIKSTPLHSAPAATSTKSVINSNILFEGYSKIILNGLHVGYTVLRYEFDPKKKQFQATYLVKTEEQGGNILESLKAVADQDLKPISYQYVSLIDKKPKTIEATFKGLKMTGLLKEGNVSKKLISDLPKGTGLAIFLYYLILRSPEGLKTETKYNYKAIAEEDAKVYDGVAIIGKEEKFNGLRAFKASNTFKDVNYTFYLTETGEALMTDTPAANIKTILVAKPEEAIAKFNVPTPILSSLFGQVPAGSTNAVTKSLNAEVRKHQSPPPTKREGIPPDPKIMIKGSPESTSGTQESAGE